MKTSALSDNTLAVSLEANEVLYYAERHLKSRRLGIPFKPPYALSAPIGRLWNGCYWLGRLEGREAVEDTELVGGSPTGCFVVEDVAPGDQVVVDPSALAAFVVSSERAGSTPVLKSWFWGLIKPGFWMWGHAVPCVFAGPVTLILYGDRLRKSVPQERRRWRVEQLVAFDASADVHVEPLETEGLYSTFLNATTWRCRVALPEGALALVRDFAPGRAGQGSFIGRFAWGIFVVAAMSVFARWLL